MTSFSYLTKDNVVKRYTAAKTYTDELTVPFPEFQRIARNKPYRGDDPNYPSVTDGTTASIIRKTPKRIIQQLPTGSVVTDGGDWLGIVGNFILTNKILPYANEEYDLIQKCWTVIENGLSFGSCATYTPFINHDGYMCPDLSTIYWGDIMLQPGKKSGYACSYVFMRSWWQKEDIESLIDRETKLKTSKEKRGETYDSSWDLDALGKVKIEQGEKDAKAMTPEEKERGTSSTPIELVTGFQKGIGGQFFTFNPGTKEIVRTETNKDPRGKIPIDFMYGDIDGTNPLGRGIIELVGGLQNLIDSDMQMYQYNRALMLDPPIVKKGTFSKNKVKYAPAAIIDMGSDMNGEIIPLNVDTTAIENYPALYGLQKSQLLNLVNSPDSSISSDVGNPSFSKTAQGVQQQQAVISVDDNYVTKMFEAWFEHWAETALNLYFAKRSGIEELQLDKDTAMKLRELPGFKESLLNEQNQIRINYNTDTPALKFRVDPNTTSVKDKAAQVADATNLLDIVMKYSMLNSNFGGPIDVDVLARRIVVNSGVDDPEQVAPEPTEAQKQSKELQKNKVSPFSPMFDKPAIRMDYTDLPPSAQIQLLANAGVQVTPQDVMGGPVLDPNLRGVMNPASDPNELLPGQQPGQAPNSGMAPIDLGDIYKQTTDPVIKAQIEHMAGLQPDPNNVANQVQTNAVQHVSGQVTNAANAANALNPPQPTQTQPASAKAPKSGEKQPLTPQLQAEDHQMITQLTQLGFSADVINQAVEQINSGVPAQQVIQQLAGATNG